MTTVQSQGGSRVALAVLLSSMNYAALSSQMLLLCPVTSPGTQQERLGRAEHVETYGAFSAATQRTLGCSEQMFVFILSNRSVATLCGVPIFIFSPPGISSVTHSRSDGQMLPVLSMCRVGPGSAERFALILSSCDFKGMSPNVTQDMQL